MISQVSGSDGSNVSDYGLRSRVSRDSAEAERLKPPSGTIPKWETPDDQVAEANAAGRDRIAETVTNSLMNRIYDAAGLSHSLSQAQDIQAGEIDTRR